METQQGIEISNRGNRSQPANAVIAEVRMDGERIFVAKNESTTWDLYNNEARKVDDELVKDWTASLNFLLVFAAIFAAILTAFVIESKKMLEPDQTELLVDIVIQYFNHAGNVTNIAFSRPDYEPSFAAISINCLFFASLGTSLVAALASVVALQWVADYDAAITRGGSSPREQAQRRQFRFAGVRQWRMGELIASLPLLLYSSVVLFWVGAIQWMWTLHHVVGYIVAGGTAIAVLFYVSTTLLATAFVSSPFRTPLSRGMYWLLGQLVSTILRLVSWFPFKKAGSLAVEKLGAAWSTLGGFMVSLHLGPESSIIKWINDNLMPGQTSLKRERDAAEKDPTFEQEALTWLIQQLPRAAHSKKRLILLVSGIQQLAETTGISPRFNVTPWQDLFKFLNNHYLQSIFDLVASEEDYREFDILVKSHWAVSHQLPRGSNWLSDPDPPVDSIPTQPPTLPVNSNPTQLPGIPSPPDLMDTFGILVHQHGEVLLPCHSPDECNATWQLIESRNQTERGMIGVLREIFKDIWLFSPDFRKWCRSYLRRALLQYHSLWDWHDQSTLGELFATIIDQGLTQLTPNGDERVALARLFEVYLTGEDSIYPELFDPASLTRSPLRYGLSLANLSWKDRLVHYKITLLVARRANTASVGEDRQRWARWIDMMLWIGSRKRRDYWEGLIRSYPNGVETQSEELWREIYRARTIRQSTLRFLHFAELDEVEFTQAQAQPHFDEITAISRRLTNEDVDEAQAQAQDGDHGQ